MSNLVAFPASKPERDMLRERRRLRDAARDFAAILIELQAALATLIDEAGEDE